MALTCFESIASPAPIQPRAGAKKVQLQLCRERLMQSDGDRCEGYCAEALKTVCLSTLVVLAYNALNSYKSINGATFSIDSQQKQGLLVAAGVGFVTFNAINRELRQRKRRNGTMLHYESKKNK